MKNKQLTFAFLIIVILAAFLRIYRLDLVPPSLTWDEAAVGYNAWTISNYGKDEWGESFPLAFKSFEEYKLPVHIYTTALFVKFMGLSELSTRLPVAIFGIACVIIIFFLSRKIFKSDLAGFIAAFFLSISPYAIHFSRFNHEANFALFYFMLGVLLFLLGLERKNKLIPLAFLSFGLGLISYNAAKIVVPLLVLILVLFYIKDLLFLKRQFMISILIFTLFILGVIFNPGLSGRSRVEQTSSNFGNLQILTQRYLAYFSPEYLFFQGDKNPRLGVQAIGQFYTVDGIFLVLGTLGLLYKRSRIGYFLLIWAILAPLPGTLFGGGGEIPHAARASFTLGSWHLISTYGVLSILYTLEKLKHPKIIWLRNGLLITFVIYLAFSGRNWLTEYFKSFNEKYAIEWQYGMKQIVGYVKEHNEYSQVYMTDVRAQPYIFFLYYLKMPLPEFLKTADYNHGEHRSSNLVTFFDKYFFGGWDIVESMPNPGVLYVVSPYEYDGLRHREEFMVKKVIYYPNGTTAFYIVSLN